MKKIVELCKRLINKLKRIAELYEKIKNKVIEVLIITMEYLYAVCSVFKKIEDESEFVGLNPINNADEKGVYSKELKYAMDNPKITNIAISSIYSAGKSSVIRTFFSKLENVKYDPIYISVMPFLEIESNKHINKLQIRGRT